MIELVGTKDVYVFDPTNLKLRLKKNGRFSNVYIGKSLTNQKNVIVKELHPRHHTNELEILRFKNEHRPDLNAPFLAHSLEYIVADQNHYLIRSYEEGTDLKNFISSSSYKKKIRPKNRKEFILGLLQVVDQLHQLNCIHGDIKPSNFIIAENENKLPEIKLIDLGLSIQSKPNPELHNTPLPFSFIYSSPELMMNEVGLLDERTDVFSCAVLIYELLSGITPWKEDLPSATMNLQLVYPLPDTKKINGKILEVLRKASHKYTFSVPPNRVNKTVRKLYLEEARDLRYKSIREFITELEKIDSELFNPKPFWKSIWQ